MTTSTGEVTYRVRIRDVRGEKDVRLVDINDYSGSNDGLRKQWVEKITNHIWCLQSNSLRKTIRPWDFILHLDGSVESLPVPEMEGESRATYPAHYRIPPASIDSLPPQDQITRQERFAFASLLYEVTSGRKPFEGLSSDEVQHHYSNAEFPDDVRTLPLFIAILSFWSVEFADIANPPRSALARAAAGAGTYVKAHPYLFAAQVTGALLATAAAAAPAILGAVGFGALGPIAGSAAAGWQASVGIIEAGSLFAWCQSAAMGGAAVNTIIATGAAGGGLAVAATAAAAGQSEGLDVDALFNKFKEVFRKEMPGGCKGIDLKRDVSKVEEAANDKSEPC